MLRIQESRIQSDSFRPRSAPIDTLVLHYTALDLESSLRVLRFRDVSVHYVLAPDGTAHRILRNDEVGWHAGLSMWGGKPNVNSRSIGIEIVNLDGNSNEYPTEQISALIELCHEILRENPAISARNIVGHSDIAPKRKVDPGKKFPWKDLARAGIGLWPSDAKSETVATTTQIQSLLESCGYPPEHAYGVKGASYVFVSDPTSPPVGVSKVIRVGTTDILKAFQLRFQPEFIAGSANPATMRLLHGLSNASHLIK